MRLVIDTNLWVSYFLRPASPLNAALGQITRNHTLLYSHATLFELAEVLSRPKFRRYVDLDDVKGIVMALSQTGEEIIVSTTLAVCRDPKDDKFLELATDGDADMILTGDGDLLSLGSYEEVAV